MPNKRKYRRFPCFVPVNGKAGSPFDTSATVDFSKYGFGFISQERIPLNKEITIEIDLGVEEDPIFVTGTVKWVRKEHDKFRVGIFFKNVLKGSKSRLDKFFTKIS